MNGKGLDKLLAIMIRLRDPADGCPWDLQQDFSSLLPFTLEEVYEVVDAIERQDYAHLCEELGDLLFQIVFYAQIAAERNLFDMSAILDGIAAKLLVRHPHVFARVDGEAVPDIEQLHVSWESRKLQDRQKKGIHAVLGDIPLALPAIQRAHKIQSRLAKVGFDWPDAQAVMQQLRDELDELQQAIQTRDLHSMTDELGDVLFTCVNLARHLQLDAEVCLRTTNTKVAARIAWMESVLQAKQQGLSDKSMDELEELWSRAKQALLSVT